MRRNSPSGFHNFKEESYSDSQTNKGSFHEGEKIPDVSNMWVREHTTETMIRESSNLHDACDVAYTARQQPFLP